MGMNHSRDIICASADSVENRARDSPMSPTAKNPRMVKPPTISAGTRVSNTTATIKTASAHWKPVPYRLQGNLIVGQAGAPPPKPHQEDKGQRQGKGEVKITIYQPLNRKEPQS